MKKLGKLQINPERVIKNDELLILRGGYDGSCQCLCATYNPDAGICGTIYSPNGDCSSACEGASGCEGGEHTWGECI